MPYSFRNKITPDKLKLFRRSKEILKHSEENPEWVKSTEFLNFSLELIGGVFSDEDRKTISNQTINMDALLKTHKNTSFHDCVINLAQSNYSIINQKISFTKCTFVLLSDALTSISFEVDGELSVNESIINFDLLIAGIGERSSFNSLGLVFQKNTIYVEETSTKHEFNPVIVFQGGFENVSVGLSSLSSIPTDLNINCEFLNNLTLKGSFAYVSLERRLFLTISSIEKKGWLKLLGFSCDFLRFEIDFYFSKLSMDSDSLKYLKSNEFKKRAQHFLNNQDASEVAYVYFWSLESLRDLLISSGQNKNVKEFALALGYLAQENRKKFSLVSFLYYDIFLCFFSVKRIIWITFSLVVLFWIVNYIVKYSLGSIDDETFNSFVLPSMFSPKEITTKLLIENFWNDLASRIESFVGIVSSILVGWVITREMD